jgi:phosphoribosyl 1,2-cyclic phosphodiesterase
MRLTFLGTGAAGGTPGRGRSRRGESSMLVAADGSIILVDAPAGIECQLADVSSLRAVLLTHAHRDAAGGLAGLRRWCEARAHAPLPVLASPEAIAAVRDRHRRMDRLKPVAVEPRQRRRAAGLRVRSVEVPHARERRYRTYAWRLDDGRTWVVYASDVARLEAPLARLADGADVLVVDGAMWGRPLFSHLTVDRELPTLCHRRARRILLPQIGRTAPPHERFERAIAELCPRAAPAWDGLTIDLDGHEVASTRGTLELGRGSR